MRDASVTGMISLRTPDKPAMRNSVRSRISIDTDDFHDREPFSLTMILTTRQP
jgi:hypothetical protein